MLPGPRAQQVAERDGEIAALLADGLTNSQISRRLGLRVAKVERGVAAESATMAGGQQETADADD